jgi:carboxymethylenebutenolidase
MPLTAEQTEMLKAWEAHLAAEFAMKSIDATMATMTPDPFVNHVPVMTGGVGYEKVKHFYSTWFLPSHPADTNSVFVRRTIGDSSIVDELVHSFTHDIEMPWILPGVPPTHKKVEVAIVVVVEFEDGKVQGERIYWDQATVLAQIGLLDAAKLPVCGAEAARKVIDPSAEPSNALIRRAK